MVSVFSATLSATFLVNGAATYFVKLPTPLIILPAVPTGPGATDIKVPIGATTDATLPTPSATFETTLAPVLTTFLAVFLIALPTF